MSSKFFLLFTVHRPQQLRWQDCLWLLANNPSLSGAVRQILKRQQYCELAKNIVVLSRCRRTLIKVYFCISCFSFFTFVFDIFCESKRPRVIRNSVQLQTIQSPTKFNALEWWWWHYVKGHGHESQRWGEERSSRTVFCALHGQFLPHFRSLGCIWPAFAVFQFCTRVQVPVCIYVPMDACDQPFTLPFAFSLGHLAIEGRTHKIFKLVV